MDIGDLLEAWRTNCQINLDLLALCKEADLDLKPGKGKTIRSNYVHIVGFRRAQLEERMRREAETVPKLDWKASTRDEIVAALNQTDGLMERAFQLQEKTGKPGRWTTARFFAYNVAHEANHRSQIEIALRLNGCEPPVEVLYRLWNWHRKAES